MLGVNYSFINIIQIARNVFKSLIFCHTQESNLKCSCTGQMQGCIKCHLESSLAKFVMSSRTILIRNSSSITFYQLIQWLTYIITKWHSSADIQKVCGCRCELWNFKRYFTILRFKNVNSAFYQVRLCPIINSCFFVKK